MLALHEFDATTNVVIIGKAAPWPPNSNHTET